MDIAHEGGIGPCGRAGELMGSVQSTDGWGRGAGCLIAGSHHARARHARRQSVKEDGQQRERPSRPQYSAQGDQFSTQR